ncbi:MAG TPA: heavy metal translocating P-type ATPase [Methylomirabilota bacterium]|jgi:Cu+-exporting ATPase
MPPAAHPKTSRLDLPVTGMHRAACVHKVERALRSAPGVVGVTVNLAAERARVHLGTDAPAEAAEIPIMRDDLRGVVTALELSRATMRIVKQNLGRAFGYKLVLVPAAAGMLYPIWGLRLPPILGGLAMALSSVSVIANSLRLGRFRPAGGEGRS